MGEEIVISLNNISKSFKQYAHPVDRLKELVLHTKSRAQEFWALRDINLEIFKGQTVGIVGRNGSGKSTLLQIIVKTLIPTTGDIIVNGRVAALLELGSGFNPEFTGRQNVFFNGRILGLSQTEIETKFDEIAAFADIGDFINQPVKTYSSGMFVRLAFAVAISSNPDILVVDEALSVGDEAFQRKCFSRIQSIQEQGRTILFVSHSAASIIELCQIAFLIDRGELLLKGTPKVVVSKYQKLIYVPSDKLEITRQSIRNLNYQTNNEEVKKINGIVELSNEIDIDYDPNIISQSTISYISQGAKIENVCVTNIDRKKVNILRNKQEYIYKYEVKFTEIAYQVRFGMLIKTVSGFELGGAVSHTLNQPIECINKGDVVDVEFKFRCLLQPGVYFFNAGVVGFLNGTETYLDRQIDVAMFRVYPEEDMLSTGLVDFCVQADVSFIKLQKFVLKDGCITSNL